MEVSPKGTSASCPFMTRIRGHLDYHRLCCWEEGAPTWLNVKLNLFWFKKKKLFKAMLEYRGLFPSPCSVVGCHMAVSFLDTKRKACAAGQRMRASSASPWGTSHVKCGFSWSGTCSFNYYAPFGNTNVYTISNLEGSHKPSLAGLWHSRVLPQSVP